MIALRDLKCTVGLPPKLVDCRVTLRRLVNLAVVVLKIAGGSFDGCIPHIPSFNRCFTKLALCVASRRDRNPSADIEENAAPQSSGCARSSASLTPSNE